MNKNDVKLLRKDQAETLAQGEDIKKLFAKDAMITPVFLYPEDDAEEMLEKLKHEHINTCIVVSKEKKFVGEISENDIIKIFLQQAKYEPLVKILNRGYRRKFLYKNVKNMINRHKSIVYTDTAINKVIELVWKEGFEYIPVLDDKMRVVGVVTPSSLINLLKDY